MPIPAYYLRILIKLHLQFGLKLMFIKSPGTVTCPYSRRGGAETTPGLHHYRSLLDSAE